MSIQRFKFHYRNSDKQMTSYIDIIAIVQLPVVHMECYTPVGLITFVKYCICLIIIIIIRVDFFEKVGCHYPPWLPILSNSHEVLVSHSRPFCDV